MKKYLWLIGVIVILIGFHYPVLAENIPGQVFASDTEKDKQEVDREKEKAKQDVDREKEKAKQDVDREKEKAKQDLDREKGK
ncbi:MAG: hypothetical protein HQK59_07040 [Deltaproteobacteria bacterium]|nr:hypothetical protein [Deltaproteobacteria bacterium]